MYDISLKPVFYASVSGGKDSFFMLNLILNNPEKYPLDMVVNFDLEIDWNFSKKVVNLMQERCNAAGIKFVKIKPRKKWIDLYNKYGMPTAHARWCNSDYKLDCKKQLNEWILSQNCRPLAYIGFCADEKKRFKYSIGDDWKLQDICYPLAEEGIEESEILMWARNQDIFDDYYKYFKRQGCKFCPFFSMREFAYLYMTDQEAFERMFFYIKETERKILEEKGKVWLFRNEGADIIKDRIITKWYPRLKNEMNQINMFDYLKNMEEKENE